MYLLVWKAHSTCKQRVAWIKGDMEFGPVSPSRNFSPMSTLRVFMTTMLVLPLLVLSAGCDAVSTLQDGLKQAKTTSEKIENATGKLPSVGFNWENGRLLQVSIQFEEIPKHKTFEELSEIARKAVKSNFSQEPGEIVISVSINPL